jgi:hypothetical protein
MSEVEVFPVPEEGVPVVWTQVAPLLEPAVARTRGKMTMPHLLGELLDGRQLLWLAVEDGNPTAAITTKVVDYPGCRVLMVDWIGGESMVKWFDLAHSKIVAHAKANNCTRLEAIGRKGWEKINAHHGWTADYVGYAMEL